MRASPRLLAVAAVILVAAAILAFTWVSGSNVAGAASTTATPAATPAADHHCTHHDGSGGGSGNGTAAPSSGSTSGTEL